MKCFLSASKFPSGFREIIPKFNNFFFQKFFFITVQNFSVAIQVSVPAIRTFPNSF